MQLNSTVFSKSTNRDTSSSSWLSMTAASSWYVPFKTPPKRSDFPLDSSVNGRYLKKKRQKDWKHAQYNMTKFCKQQQYSPEHCDSSLFPTKAAASSLPSIPRAPSFLFSGHGSNLLMISRQCSLVTFVICKSSENAVLTINHSFSELSALSPVQQLGRLSTVGLRISSSPVGFSLLSVSVRSDQKGRALWKVSVLLAAAWWQSSAL